MFIKICTVPFRVVITMANMPSNKAQTNKSQPTIEKIIMLFIREVSIKSLSFIQKNKLRIIIIGLRIKNKIIYTCSHSFRNSSSRWVSIKLQSSLINQLRHH